MQNNFRLRIGVPAAFAAAIVPIVLAIYEVQGWTMPTPLGETLVVILLIMMIVAPVIVFYEFGRRGFQILEARATSAAWVSAEEPGLLDYEADGMRASERFVKELAKLAKDTRKLGESLPRHTERILAAAKNPRLKQKRANQSAKSIDRSAMFIEKRASLLQALVKDIFRNFNGLVTTSSLETEEDKSAAVGLTAILEGNRSAVEEAIISTSGYRDSVRNVEKQNLSRTVRIATKRLGDGLDDTLKILRQFSANSRKLREMLERRLR